MHQTVNLTPSGFTGSNPVPCRFTHICTMSNKLSTTSKFETFNDKKEKIREKLRLKYPGKEIVDLSRGEDIHIACVTDPGTSHPEFDVAIEIMIKTAPHKHNETTQRYKILEGELILHLGDTKVSMRPGDEYIVKPGTVHWTEALTDECMTELLSTPAWTPEDHILVETPD